MEKESLNEIVNWLKRQNNEIENDKSDVQLSKLFDACLQLQHLIENCCIPSNSKEFQEATSVCIKALENCTVMVNNSGMFSSNETAEDLQTGSIKYLLLPAMLGYLYLSTQSTNLPERSKYIQTSEVYFKDFLTRCSNYELCEESLKYFKDALVKETNCENGPEDIMSAREKKIQIFKRKKDLENQEKALKSALQRPDLEESIREYYFVLLERWILTSTEELENLKREADILKSIPANGVVSKHNATEHDPKVKPLKPFIITKNAAQKAVFGLGYPSIPVMTVDDYYRHKFEKTVEEHKQNKTGKSLQDSALRGESLKSETEEIEKEELLERDDPAALLKARQWDDWKDDNPRGSGNRYNKG